MFLVKHAICDGEGRHAYREKTRKVFFFLMSDPWVASVAIAEEIMPSTSN